MRENEQEVIPVPERHYKWRSELVRALPAFYSFVRGNVPEVSTVWPKSMYQQIQNINPSVVTFDGLYPSECKDVYPYLIPGGLFELRAKDQDTQDVFLVGADFFSLKQFKEILSNHFPSDYNFTLDVLSTYAQRHIPELIKGVHMARSGSTLEKYLNLRNALMTTKVIESSEKLGSKKGEGPSAAVVGEGHTFLADFQVWSSQEVRQEILLNIFTEIFKDCRRNFI